LKRFAVYFFALCCFAVGFASAEPEASAPVSEDVLCRYLAASQEQQTRMRGVSMETDIEARIPKLKKEGRLQALRRISSIGRITYDLFRFSGDNTIKKEVIARYLNAEQDAIEKNQNLSITPENYKFKYKGLHDRNDRRVHVFEVKPHKKRVGLFKGELWVDPDTYLAIREAGQFVKSPSIFLKKVEFVREYEIEDGLSVLRHMNTKIDTRLIGRAELNVTYTDFKRDSEEMAAPVAVLDNQ
jgi:hypothetical protein